MFMLHFHCISFLCFLLLLLLFSVLSFERTHNAKLKQGSNGDGRNDAGQECASRAPRFVYGPWRSITINDNNDTVYKHRTRLADSRYSRKTILARTCGINNRLRTQLKGILGLCSFCGVCATIQAVWNQLTELFPPGSIPHYFVMKTMGDLAVCGHRSLSAVIVCRTVLCCEFGDNFCRFWRLESLLRLPIHLKSSLTWR